MTTGRSRLASTALLVLAALASAAVPGSAVALSLPIEYVWSGTFEDGSGAFNNRSFSITFTVADPSTPDEASSSNARYYVDASLVIDGIGAFEQTANWDLAGFAATTAALGAFADILAPGDTLYFGICTGGSCDDPVLWNSDPFGPVLYTGVFPLGLEASCTFPGPCDNAVANYFDGAGGGYTTHYEGTLSASAVPLPGAALLLLCALTALAWARHPLA